MSYLKQDLEINPSDKIKLIGPLTRTLFGYLTLKNPTHYGIAFKVRTTSTNDPLIYTITPNAGILAAGNVKQIILMYEAQDVIPKKLDHKIQILAFYLLKGIKNVDNIDWKNLKKDYLMESKMRIVHIKMDQDTEEGTSKSLPEFVISEILAYKLGKRDEATKAVDKEQNENMFEVSKNKNIKRNYKMLPGIVKRLNCDAVIEEVEEAKETQPKEAIVVSESEILPDLVSQNVVKRETSRLMERNNVWISGFAILAVMAVGIMLQMSQIFWNQAQPLN